MTDFVVCVIGDVLWHVSVEIFERCDIVRVSGIGIVIVVNLSAELVVLLPQISLNKLDRRGKPQQCGIALGKSFVRLGEQLAGRQRSRARNRARRADAMQKRASSYDALPVRLNIIDRL